MKVRENWGREGKRIEIKMNQKEIWVEENWKKEERREEKFLEEEKDTIRRKREEESNSRLLEIISSEIVNKFTFDAGVRRNAKRIYSSYFLFDILPSCVNLSRPSCLL